MIVADAQLFVALIIMADTRVLMHYKKRLFNMALYFYFEALASESFGRSSIRT